MKRSLLTLASMLAIWTFASAQLPDGTDTLFRYDWRPPLEPVQFVYWDQRLGRFFSPISTRTKDGRRYSHRILWQAGRST